MSDRAIDIDDRRAAGILKNDRSQGPLSLEFAGKHAPATAVPESLAPLRKAFA